MSAQRPRAPSSGPARPGMMFGRGGPGMMGTPAEKARNFRGTMGRLVAYLRPFWATLVVVLVFAIASTLFAIVSPRILGNITNKVVDGYTQERVYDQVVSRLPAGTQIPPGTTGADVLARLPPDVVKQIPTAQRSAIETMDLSHRPGIDFDGILRLVELL
ncbi:MAG TPA: hypothetical protein VH482_13165, partial [Thermomicrobiales bacterium]